MTITADIKAQLFNKALVKSRDVFPCNDRTFDESFDEDDGVVIFWYMDIRGGSHMAFHKDKE